MISIVGSGLTGLTCALELLKSNISVEIFEARQEVGNPIRSPGLLSNLDSKYIDITDAKKNEIGWGFRREWLEKTLAQEVLSKGGTIHLKQNISNLEGMVDCRGGKSISSGSRKLSSVLTLKSHIILSPPDKTIEGLTC